MVLYEITEISPESNFSLVLQELSEELELEFDKKERELLQRLAGEDGMVIENYFKRTFYGLRSDYLDSIRVETIGASALMS